MASGQESPGHPRINKIKLTGCKQISCKTVKAVLRQQQTPWYKIKIKEGGFDPFWAESDRARIEQFYRGRGYYSAKADKPEVVTAKNGRGVEIFYKITEGKPVLVSKVDVKFEETEKDGIDRKAVLVLVKLKPGNKFELENYQTGEDAIEFYYKDRGYYRADAERRAEVDPGQRTAVVEYLIKAGDRYKLNEVSIDGCRKTKPRVVQKALLFKPGQWYSREDMIESDRRVEKMPIYQSARIAEKVDDQKKTVDLSVTVEEAKPREFKLGLGYGSEEGVRVQGAWSHINFLGGARQLTISARWSTLLEKEEISFLQPNLPKFEDYAQLTFRRKVEDESSFSYESLALIPGYHWNISKDIDANFFYRIEQNHTTSYLDINEVNEEQLAKEGILSALTATLEWSDLDIPLKPTKGARMALLAETGGGPLGGDFDYYKAVGEARAYYPIFSGLVVAGRVKMGWAEPAGGLAVLPLFLRFYSGGTGSVRGFDRHQLGQLDQDQKAIGGTKLLETSLEIRAPIYGNFGAAAFVDGGWVWPEGQEYDLNDLIFSAGFGLRYDTVVGPIAVDLGFPLTSNPVYPDYRIHINIGEAF